MNPFNDTNLPQGMLFNPNFNGGNTHLGNLNGANPNNFYALNPNIQPLNPNLQPMAQNNQLGVLQLLAAQLQSNPQLQINLLNQLQAQNLAAPFQQGGMPFIMGHNPNQMMMGMPNGQFLAHHQMLQANQMMGPNNMGLGFGNAPRAMGQNPMHGGPVAVPNSNQPQLSSGPMNTQWNKKNVQRANGTQKFQVNHAEARITDNSHVNARNSASKGPARNIGLGKEPSHNRFQKSQLHDGRGSKRNMKQFNRRGARGEHNWIEQQSHSIYSGEETPTVCQRPLPLNYTKTEIQQWREARKKNFPTNKKKATVSENNKDADARLCRQQLKEVLAKQAELGVEVAEVPASYLCEPEDLIPKKENEREAIHGPSANKFNKKRGRGRGRDNRRFKRQKFNNKGAPTSPPSVKREPSLLEKLLSSDVKRDKSRLLQVFRFMVLNNFFKQLPGKPLEFPVITVKDDGGCGSKIIREADPSLDGTNSPADVAIEKTLAEGINSKKESCVAEEMEDKSDGEDTVGTGEQFEESEEGEITD